MRCHLRATSKLFQATRALALGAALLSAGPAFSQGLPEMLPNDACPFPADQLPQYSKLPDLRQFPTPAPTEWKPEGTRGVPDYGPVLGGQNLWRQRHGDNMNRDEITTAIGPKFEIDWVSDETKFHTVAASFDREGNAYTGPVYPANRAIAEKYDGRTGETKWILTTDKTQTLASIPILFDDPESGEERLVAATREEMVVARTDGSVVWRAPTGLNAPPPEANDANFGEFITWGPEYNAKADGFVILGGNGEMAMLDRRTGRNLLAQPFRIDGAPSPRRGGILTPECGEYVDFIMRPAFFPNAPPGVTSNRITEAVIGEGVVNANNFSIIPSGPNIGRMPVSSTAPDGFDGEEDGISEYGAHVILETTPVGGGQFKFEPKCFVPFLGGSATTAAGSPDGSRFYTADSDGNLLAIATDNCEILWSLDLPEQIIASPAVANDNGEIYTASFNRLIQVLDRGDHGERGWTASVNICVRPDDVPAGPGFLQGQLVSAPIGANRLAITAGCGPLYRPNPDDPNDPDDDFSNVAFLIPLRIGAVAIDRQTGQAVSYGQEFEDATSLVVLDQNGGMYNPRSPTRDIFSRLYYPDLLDPVVRGGLARFKPEDYALLFREGAHAAKDRERRAYDIRLIQADGTLADLLQTEDSVAQFRRLASRAIDERDLSSRQWKDIDKNLRKIENLHHRYRNAAEKGKGETEADRILESSALWAEIESLTLTSP
jgi:hypothetical protein